MPDVVIAALSALCRLPKCRNFAAFVARSCYTCRLADSWHASRLAGSLKIQPRHY